MPYQESKDIKIEALKLFKKCAGSAFKYLGSLARNELDLIRNASRPKIQKNPYGLESHIFYAKNGIKLHISVETDLSHIPSETQRIGTNALIANALQKSLPVFTEAVINQIRFDRNLPSVTQQGVKPERSLQITTSPTETPAKIPVNHLQPLDNKSVYIHEKGLA